MARITGRLDTAILKRALNAIVARHEILRTRIVCRNGIPSQEVAESGGFDLQYVDQAHSPGKKDVELESFLRKEMNRPFDLSHDILARALLVKVSTDEHVLVVTMHHIVSDEWSVKIFFHELAEFYDAFLENRAESLAELPIQYADYSIWQRDWLQGEVLDEQLNYWEEKLRNCPPALELLADHPRTLIPTFTGGNISRPFGKKLTESLQRIANREGATLFMVMLAGLKALLHRYTEGEDIIVGSPIAGRNRVETEDLIGFFVNTLALRTKLSGDLTFRELLKRVRETTLGAYAHQDIPFEKLVEQLHPERSSHHLHFSNVMFVLQQSMPEAHFSGLELRFPDVVSEMSKFELTLAIQETSDGLVARAEYNADLFDESTIARLLGHLETFLKGITADPEQQIGKVSLLTEKQFEEIVVEWNRTKSEFPRAKCVHEVFEAQAALSPESTALVFAGKQLTYGELNARANQLAHFLKRFNVGPDVPVSICMNRSNEMIIGLLAILKAGGAYVPLDAGYPAERLEFMLADSRVSVLLTEQTLLSRLPRNISKILCLDTDWELITGEPRNNLQTESNAENLAYIMYTSGSTGQPKGVAVPHRAINRLVLNTNYLERGSLDRVAQISNISFDAATFEIWGPLLNGGQLIGISNDVALSPQDFARELREHRISGMFLTAALFNQLSAEVQGAFAELHTLIVGGEALDPKWTRAVLKNGPPRRLLNGYGPTENTTFSCCHIIEEVPEGATNVPIGRPIANTTVYVLDPYLNPAPVSIAGNLYVGGDGLARGYWNRPEITTASFIPNPYGPGLLYKTGDRARYLPGGVIEFLGRQDGQVKIRGFRIEPSEVEAILNRHPDVRECAVITTLTDSGQKRLTAYFVPAGKQVTASELREFLGEKLPQYMIPATFVQLPRLPLTPNGKLDRKALPEPDQARPELQKTYVSPRDPVEHQLTNIWEEVIGVRPIGIEDKFFDLGGHSILAVRLVAKMEEAFNKKIRLATIFQAPTIAQIAEILRENPKQSPTADASSSLVEIQSRGTRPPLFLVHGAGGGMFWGYVNLARHLGNQQPVYGFRSRGLDGNHEFERLEEMAAQYIHDLRVVQPHGPYHLGGYCFGGNVAYEMARQLSAAGEEIALLALINCAPPNSSYGQIGYTPAWLARFFQNLIYWGRYSGQWTQLQRRDFIRWKLKMAGKNLKAMAGFSTKRCTQLDVENIVDLSTFSLEQQKLWETHIRAQFNYKPEPFPGRVHLFRSPGHPVWCSFDPKYGWADLAMGGVEVTMVPAGHEKILEEPFVKVVADGLRNVLEINRESSEKATNSRLTLPGQTSIERRIDNQTVPLSCSQQRLWFLDQLEHGNPVYHQIAAFRLERNHNAKLLADALDQLVQRHEVLRTVYASENGQPVGKVTTRHLKLERIDLIENAKFKSEANKSKHANVPVSVTEQISKAVETEKRRSFDLAADLPIRASLIELGANDQVLLVTIHEIAADTEAIQILFTELASILKTGVSEPSLPWPTQYANFAQRQWKQSDAGEWSEQLAFWKRQLTGAPELLEFPADFSRPAQQSYRGKTERIQLLPTLAHNLGKAAQQLGVEPFDLFGSAVLVLLKRYIRQDESVIGTMVKGREEPQFENLIGNFENLVLIRADLSGNPAFVDLLKRFSQTKAEAMANRTVPFEKILQELRPARDQSYHPLTQVLFGCQSRRQTSIDLADSRLSQVVLKPDTTKFDLSFLVLEDAQGLSLQVNYATDLFRPETISRLLDHWQRLLEGIVKDPEQRVSELPLLSSAEQRILLTDWTNTEQDYPKDKTLVDLFVEQAARTPDAIALVSGEKRLTYSELYARANIVRNRLRALGVKNEVLVGLCLERSWEMVTGILGALWAGAAYVPMDPAYPQDRIEFMAQDAQLRVILTERKLLNSLPRTEALVICVDDLDWNCTHAAPEPNALKPKATDLAYIIYTSGSTGKPKGVALEHRNAVAFVYWAKSVFSSEELSGVLAATSICFDLSIFEMFVPLSWGGKVILAENALALSNLPAANEVKLINTVPSAIRELLRAKGVPASVKVVNLAGEPLPTALVEEIYSQSNVQKVFDLYGPTETTTYSTFTLRKPKQPATIGRPLANEQVYLLDGQRQLVPIGVPGELYIGGDGVARGYLNRPEMTAERFVANPFRSGARLYRTGDLARWREDGNLEFLGRIDHQVKIRGFRIELGEVESALKKQPQVSEAVVMAREDPSGNKRLVAYLVLDVNASFKPSAESRVSFSEELRRGLRVLLPEYMLPSMFIFLDALPLTPNGKVDRKALPPPELDEAGSAGKEEEFSAVQEQVAAIWREVLQIKHVGLRDSFFDLGGHSLLAFQVISRIRTIFKVEVPLSGLFDAPTISALADALAEGRWKKQEELATTSEPASREGNLLLSFVQERLWFLDQLNPGSPAYNVPMALRLKGPLNSTALQQALNQVVQRHEALRTSFRYDNGTVTQIIEPSLEVKIRHVEQPAENRSAADENQLGDLLSVEARVPFNLSAPPLIRALLVKVSEEEHAFLVVMHHTISDGWSLAVFFRELSEFYRAFCHGSTMPQLPALPVQYADFAIWQRDWMQGAVLEKELNYWKKSLKGAPARLELPTDKTDPAAPSGKAERRSIELSHDLTARMAALSGTGTPFMVLLAALGITLQKWTGQKEMVIGTVVAGRSQEKLENLIGCFMNFLPIRIEINGDETSHEALLQVRTAVLEAQNHQECPFEKIVEAVNPERTSNQNPLYNVGLLLQNFPPQIFHTDSIESALIPIDLKAALLDLRFEAEQNERGYTLSCEYRTELFEDETIKELLASICRAIESITQTPELKLKEIQLTSVLETQAAKASNRSVPQTIAIAATFTAEPLEESLRYWTKELDFPAQIQFAPYNQVFQQLLDPSSLLSQNHCGLNVLLVRLEDWQSPGTAAGHLDGCDNIQRSANELAVTLKSTAGRWSVPCLVCICPPSNKIIADSPEARRLAKVEESLSAELEGVSGVYLARHDELWKWYPVAEYYDASGEELGHVPYTPMLFTALGTMIVRKLHALNRPAFKVIALDCDQTLWTGVCGEDGPEGIRLDPPRRALQEFMRAQQDAGVLLCLCSKNNEEDVIQVFRHHAEMPLRLENFVASRLNWHSKPENLKELARELKLGLDSFIFVDDNPVECAAVQEQCPEVLTLLLPEDPERIPQFLNHCWAFDHLKATAEDRSRTEMYRQNQQRQQLREQAVSLNDFLDGLELKIAIEPVTSEQLPRVAQLTQRTNQFNFTTQRRTESELQTLARTAETLTVSVRDRFGDYGLVGVIIYRRENRALEVDTFLLSCRVLGRGVEHRMLARLGQLAQQHRLDWVDIHFTKSNKNKPGLDFLEKVGTPFRQALNGGYLFRFPAGVAESTRLDAPGAENLPPSSEDIKSTPDKTASSSQRFHRYRELAFEACEVEAIHKRIEAKAIHRAGGQRGHVAPRTDLERQLCELWQKLLRVERVGIQDNFFELGGHSLLAVRLFAEIEKLTKRKLPLVTLFQAPTIEQLAGILGHDEHETSRSLLVPIQPQGLKPPLFLVHGAGGDVLWGYANLAAHLPPDQPVYGIKSRGQNGQEEWRTLEEMAVGYLKEVRALQPTGPYYLGGYCFGGNVAYEMARQLRLEGESVALLALLDSAPSNAGYETISWWRPSYVFRFARNLHYWWSDFSTLDIRTRIRFVERKVRALGRKVFGRLGRRNSAGSVDIEDVIDPRLFPEHELNLWKIHLNALVEHVQKPYPGCVTLFRTRGQPLFSSLEEDFCWGKVAEAGVKVEPIPGSHESIFVEPNVQHLARELTAALGKSQEPGTSEISSSDLVSSTQPEKQLLPHT